MNDIRNDVVSALKGIQVPVLRRPRGCFADENHWQNGCEPYFSGNVGSGTIQELSQWVEYVNSDNVSPLTEIRKKNGREHSWGVKYWGIGNKN